MRRASANVDAPMGTELGKKKVSYLLCRVIRCRIKILCFTHNETGKTILGRNEVLQELFTHSKT